MSDFKVETVRDLYGRGFEYLQVVHVSEVEARDDELTRLRSKYEALRAKYATVTALADDMAEGITDDLNATTQKQQNAADHKLYEAHEDYLVFRENNPDSESQAFILHKQADAVEAFAAELQQSDRYGKKEFLRGMATSYGYATGFAQRLRDQATEAEKAGGES